MLSYKPPFLEAGNLTIFGDDTNSDVYYYICLQPSVSLKEDGGHNIGAYAILPESGVGLDNESYVEASIMLDINLRPTPEELSLAEETIKEKFGKKPKIMVPAPIHSGKVYLIMAEAGTEPNPEKWFITSEIKPSLFGDNRASLIARATGKDAKHLIAALDADTIAATVHYELEMIGIAPVFNASLKADYKKIYHHFSSLDHTNFIFYNDQVSETIDKLSETTAIEIEIEELDPDIKAAAMKNLLNELKAEVVKKIFKPAASPLTASKKWEDRIGNGAARVLASIMPGQHYMRRSLDESQLMTTTINLSQRNAKKYPFYPQCLLSTLIDSVGGISDKIKWIELDDIPFIDQRVEVRLSADTFNNSNIKSVVIDCRVVNIAENDVVTEESIVFDNDDVLGNHLNFTRQKDIDYRYDYKATMFMSTDSNKLPSKTELEWKSVDTPYIYVNPAEYFETHEIHLNLDDTSIFEHTHLIQADVHVVDSVDLEKVLNRTYLFKRDQFEQQVLNIVANKNTPLRFDLHLTYFRTDAREHTAEYPNVTGSFFFIPNPFENKWSVDLICNADWETTSKIIFETRIQDAERVDPIFNKFDFSPASKEHKLTIASSLDTPKERLEYRVTRLTAGNDIIQGPWMRHEGPILVFNDKIKSERIIRASIVDAPDFEAKEIRKVSVEFKYRDGENDIDVSSGRLNFRGSDDVVEYTHPMPDFNKKEYEYRLRVRGLSGESFKSKWQSANEENLSIIIPEDIW